MLQAHNPQANAEFQGRRLAAPKGHRKLTARETGSPTRNPHGQAVGNHRDPDCSRSHAKLQRSKWNWMIQNRRRSSLTCLSTSTARTTRTTSAHRRRRPSHSCEWRWSRQFCSVPIKRTQTHGPNSLRDARTPRRTKKRPTKEPRGITQRTSLRRNITHGSHPPHLGARSLLLCAPCALGPPGCSLTPLCPHPE